MAGSCVREHCVNVKSKPEMLGSHRRAVLRSLQGLGFRVQG